MLSESEAVQNCYEWQNYLHLHNAPTTRWSGIRGTSGFRKMRILFSVLSNDFAQNNAAYIAVPIILHASCLNVNK